MKTLFLINLAVTLMMTGVIWTIQLVHYPLFNRVGLEAFRDYQIAHMNAITLLVMPLMLIELITAFLLALTPPSQTPSILMWVAFGLVGVVWMMTAFVQVPLHNQLANGFDQAIYQALVNTNWVRTIAWSARSGLLLYLIGHVR
ncbi:MAG: hypothetical protein MUF87_11220 [Anaerolineae bacterium]|jgi:hypothetical protein|nr:hypothetical protein [Anaerolineae bacterium]